MWSGIPEVWPNQSCDICNLKKDVKSKQIPITTCGLSGVILTGQYRQSNLCKSCQKKGWILLHDTADFGRIRYWNKKSSALRVF